MAKWEKVVEEGHEFWVNDELGNIVKTKDGSFIAIIPKVIKFRAI